MRHYAKKNRAAFFCNACKVSKSLRFFVNTYSVFFVILKKNIIFATEKLILIIKNFSNYE